MLNLSLNALKLIAKSKSIEGYKIMSEDRLLSAPNASESVKMPDPANVIKTIKEIRKENCNEDKIFRELHKIFRVLLDPEKYHYKPVKTINAFNNNFIQYESVGDKEKNLSIKEYIDIIRPYLSNIINNHKTQGEWKVHSGNIITDHKTQGEWIIHLTMAIKFISFKDFDKARNLHTKIDNIEIMMGRETDEII